MSKKSFLILGIILIAFGGALIPTGYFLDNYFTEQVAEGVPDALLGIQDEALPSLEDQIPGLATPDALLGIEDEALESLQEQIPALGTPDVLLGIKEEATTQLSEQIPVLATPTILLEIIMQAIDEINNTFEALSVPSILLEIKDEALNQLPFIINCSGTAQAINQTIEAAAIVSGLALAKEDFFNNASFQVNYTSLLGFGVMEGVSDYYDGLAGDFDLVNLSYTPTAQDNLLYGNAGFPGLMDDLDLGLGVAGFLQLVYNVTLGIGPVDNATLQAVYGASWDQLEALAGYIQMYLWETIVKTQWLLAGYSTIDEFALDLFYEQWENGTLSSDGFLSLINPAFASAPYFELGIPTAGNFTPGLTLALWNESNGDTFVNISGIEVWLGAAQGSPSNQTYLLTQFAPYGLTPSNLTALLTWLGAFYTVRVPQLLEYQYQYPIEYIPIPLAFEQWANGTIGGVSVMPNGLLGMLDASLEGSPYFEVGLPTATGLPLLDCYNLWNPIDNYTFVNNTGIVMWVGALQGDTALIGNLSLHFGLTTEMPALLNWLGGFIQVRVPQILELMYMMPFSMIVESSFYEQWDYGTIQGEAVLPEGFLSQLSETYAGAPYFELGLPKPGNISLSLIPILWDETNGSTFVNSTGIEYWLGALQGDTTAITHLATVFGLNATTELPELLTWLGNFIAVRSPQLIEYETNSTIPELAQLAFYEQWANGTIQGEALLPDGFLAELGLTGAPYFEVGLPTETNMTLDVVIGLWDDTNDNAFVNGDGIEIWGEAATNTTLQTLLITEFGVSATELGTLLTWLGDFIEVRVPQLILADTGYTIPELAQVLFYEQWANGTIYGEAFLPDGFLSERDPPVYGPPYFEVGLTVGPTGLSIAQCEALWDENSDYSLVTGSGINNWYNAREGNTIWEELKTENGGLSDAQMADIKEWLPQFRDTITNKLAKDELNLPMEPYDLGNTIFIAGAAGGGALAVLGVVLAILSRRKT